MVFSIRLDKIPGTILDRSDKGVTGKAFLDSVFFLGDGIMLTQIREIAGIDGSTLQNWLKRRWVSNPVNKLYTENMLARILLINMMRDTMRLKDISALLTYVNGVTESTEDDIIPEARLYDYVCETLDRLDAHEGETTQETLTALIADVTADYREPVPGACVRLRHALEVIVLSYYASLIIEHFNKTVALISGTTDPAKP